MSFLSCILLTLSFLWSNSVANAASCDLSDAILKFTPSFYRHSSETYGGSVVVSSFTAFNALVMLSGATNGNTYTQITDALDIERNKEKVAKQMRNYSEDLRKDADSADLTIFNKIFLQRGYQLNSKFKKLATKQFEAGTQKVNFANTQTSANKVNTFVSKNTNQKIEDLVRPDLFSVDTRAVLNSGAHLKGKWERPFDKRKSYFGSFNGVPVGFMTTLDTFNYAILPELSATAVEMDYADSDLSMVIVKPDYHLSVLQYRLRDYDWTKITANMQPRWIELHLPKFRAHFQFSLNSVMTNMNMGDMLTNVADLSELLRSNEILKVFDIRHSTSVQIDERSSEIASSIGILPNTYVLADNPNCEPVVKFNATQPFFYYVRNKADDSIIFAGHILGPFPE